MSVSTPDEQIPPYQQRVLDEKTALDDKITKLDVFTSTDTFKALQFVDQNALHNQLSVMRKYSEILEYRISRFT